MADHGRYSNQERDFERGRRHGRGRDWRSDQDRDRFSDRRLDDRTGYGPGSAGGYEADRYYQGNDQPARDYGRDDEYGATYGGFEERSFGDASAGGDYGRGSGRSTSSRSAREYQTNRSRDDFSGGRFGPERDDAWRGDYGGWREGGRGRGRAGLDRETYAFNPYEGYPGISPDFGFGRSLFPDDRRGEDYRSRGRDRYRGGDERDHDRGFIEKAADEVQSWFGDDEARMRRRIDRGEHAGRGPKGYKRSDERIKEDVSERLTDDSWLDASDIEVTVSDMEVTLAGTVPDRDSKRRAEHIAEEVSGVRHVQNNLRVAHLNRGTEPVLAEGAETATVVNTPLSRQTAGRA